MMIFLTGGTGLLGSHILKGLRGAGHAVTALVRSEEGAAQVTREGAVAVRGAVEEPETWARLAAPAAIIHSAAVIAGPQSWETYLRVNVESTRFAAQRARQLGIPLIHISSVAVYGRGRSHEVTTESRTWGPLEEREYYARSKRMAEESVWQEVALGLHATAIRPCVIYGEGDRLFLPQMVRVMRRGIVPLVGSGDRPLSLVYAGNVAQAVLLALAATAAKGQVYNVTNDGVITARKFTEAVGQGLGRRIRMIPFPAWPVLQLAAAGDKIRRLSGPPSYPGSISSAVRFWQGGNPYSSEKAVRELGWRPGSRHEDAIARSVQALTPR